MAERSWRPGSYTLNKSVMYTDAILWTACNVNTSTLCSIRYLIGSQCSAIRTGVNSDVVAAPLSHYQARCRILRHLELSTARWCQTTPHYRNPYLMLRVHARLSCMHWQSSNVESWLWAGSKHSDTCVKLRPTYPFHYPRKHLCLLRFAGALCYIHTHVVVCHGRRNFTARHIKGYRLGLWFIQQ